MTTCGPGAARCCGWRPGARRRRRPPHIGSALLANPLAAVVQQARNFVVDPAYLTLADALGGAGLMLIPLAIATFAIGLTVFNREAPRIAEEL